MSLIDKNSYDGWWEESSIPEAYRERVSDAVRRAKRNRAHYDLTSEDTGLPWQLIAALMELEGSGRLDKHIANGDPLDDYTTNDPAGQPAGLTPPWTWREAAEVELREVKRPKDGRWTIRAILEAAERFNGTGPRKRGHLSAYLVSSTAIEEEGKYIRDHVWSPTATSDQVGVLAMLHGLEEAGEGLPPW